MHGYGVGVGESVVVESGSRAWASSDSVRASTRGPSVSEGELAEVLITYLKYPTACARALDVGMGVGGGDVVEEVVESMEDVGEVEDEDISVKERVEGEGQGKMSGQSRARGQGH